MKLTATATLPPLENVPLNANVSWSFGDGTPDQSGIEQEHTYTKPGSYIVTLRVEHNRRLTEFRAEVVASRNHVDKLRPPVTAFPKLVRQTNGEIPSGKTRVKCTVGGLVSNDPVVATWDIEKQDTAETSTLRGDTAVFDLKPGDYTLTFTAVRQLKTRVKCSQLLFVDRMLNFDGLSLATNRRFDKDGTEVTGVDENPQANAFVNYLYAEAFSSSDFSPELSPVNNFTVEFPMIDNPFLRTVGASDVEQFGLEEIEDVVLLLEYETGATQVLSPVH
jgi:hypothetical protein